MISFACPQCRKQLSVKKDLAGKKVKCPGCSGIVAAPAQALVHNSATAASSPAAGAVRPGAALPTPGASSIGDQPTVPPPGMSQATEAPHPGAGTSDRNLTDFLAPPQSPDELGRLGGYRILKILGHGGMGVVFEGEDPRLGRKVAIKAMLPHLAGSQSSQERFLREAKAAAALEHDHIVAIHHVGEERGASFIVMPFLKGEPLEDRLQRERILPVPEVLRIGRQMATGLAAAHAQGLVHRDIKPANVWLELPENRVKILDFGLARATAQDSGLTQQGAIIGTPAYMAPEQATGDKVDARSDLFSLGVVLYRLCTGRAPFQGKDMVTTLMAVATTDPPPPPQLNPQVPPGLSDLIMRLLQKDPARRVASAQQVAEALRQLEASAVLTPVQLTRPLTASVATADLILTPATVSSWPTPVQPALANTYVQAPSRRRRKVLFFAAGVVLAAVAAFVALTIITTPPRRSGDNRPHGFVRVDSKYPDIKIVFDKDGPFVIGASKEPTALREGEHLVSVTRAGASFEPGTLFIRQGDTVTLTVKVTGNRVQILVDEEPLGAGDLPPANVADVPPPEPDDLPFKPDNRPLDKAYTNDLGMEFCLVPKGKSWLGGGGGNDGTTLVEMMTDFYLGKYEVTQQEWEKVTGTNPSKFSIQNAPAEAQRRCPVEQVSWQDAQKFVKQLNDRLRETGWVYRLPHEVEWEYACRGGPMKNKAEGAYYYYLETPSNQLAAGQASFAAPLAKQEPPSKVGTFKPNRLGLFDMHGNVWEWCEDVEKGPDGSPQPVFRGGCWSCIPEFCRATARDNRPATYKSDGIGLRLARVRRGAPPNRVRVTNSLGLHFALIPRGKAWLGGGGGKVGTELVEFKDDFYLGSHEITQGEWQKIMGNNPSWFTKTGGGADMAKSLLDADLRRHPVENVSWDDCQKFVAAVNARAKEPGWVYRLPTQQEWEYACRGGPMLHKPESKYDYYVDEPTNKLLLKQANFNRAKGQNHSYKVGRFEPNRLGLYDMHGNVAEWCADDLPARPNAKKGDPPLRAQRGGSWFHTAANCKAATHFEQPQNRHQYDVGLRLAKVPAPK